MTESSPGITAHVCLIGIDGLRLDHVTPGVAPVLHRFAADGSMVETEMEVPTISGPGWSSILTGASHAEHGVVDNGFAGHRLLDHPDFLSLAWFADRAITTWAAASWPPLVDPAGPAPVIWWRDEAQRGGRHRVLVRDGETYGYERMDGEIVAWSRAALLDFGPRASFVYLGAVDLAGHLWGAASVEYRDAITATDARLGQLLDAIRARAAARPDERWTVAVTTDHGHLDTGGHGGAEPEVRRSFLAAQRITAPDGVVAVAAPELPADLAPRGIPAWLLGELA